MPAGYPHYLPDLLFRRSPRRISWQRRAHFSMPQLVTAEASGGELLTGLDVVAQPEIHRIQVQLSGDPAHHQLPPEGEL